MNDMLPQEWLQVADFLGAEKATGLIKNGTTLEVAKQICQQIKAMRENKQLKLF